MVPSPGASSLAFAEVFGSLTDILGGRSRINGDVGGRTQMASLVCSAVILLATFFLLPYLYYLPKCVLASM